MIGKHIILTLVALAGLGMLLWKKMPMPWSGIQILGLVLLSAGFILWTIARFQLGASFTVTAQARALVSSGIYSKIRNPIYVSGSMLVAGAALALDRPVWLLILVVIIPMQVWRARKEGAVLESKFGEQYRIYRANTWF